MKRPSENRIPLGHDFQSGEHVTLPLRAFHRGGYFTGQSGQGKSSTVCRLLTTVTRLGSPALVVDDAGETFQQLERFVAFYAAGIQRAMATLGVPEHARRQILNKKVLRRFTFGFLGHGRKNAASIDILKRRQLPDRRESIEEVMIGTLKPFEARFPDMSIRTRFVAVIGPLLTALIAAERPISEALPLLLDPRYWSFLLREIDRCKTMDDPDSRAFVQPRIAELRRILDLRRNKQGDEHEPYPQRYYDRVESTLNALDLYKPGTVTSRFFDTDSFAPEEVVFHNGVFAITSNLSDTLIRNQALATVYTFFERLMKYRAPEMGFESLSKYRLYVVLDEIRWFYPDLTWFLSVARNHRVSTFILNQQDEQWAQLGMPALADTVPSLLRLRIRYRAQTKATAEDMAMLAGRYDPFGMQQRAFTRSHAHGHTTGTSDTESQTDTNSESSSKSTTDSGSSGFSAGSNSGWYADRENASTGYSGGTSDGRSFDDGWSESESSQHGWSTASGTAHGTNESDSETETEIEHLLNAGVADQQFLRAQDMRSLPEHVAQVTWEEQARLVRMARFDGFPKVLDGLPIYDNYRRAALTDLTRRKGAERSPYDPGIRIVQPVPAAAGDEPVRPGKRTPDAPPPSPKPRPRTKR